ncbi:MAG: MoeZ/MoeB [Gemmatimonadetes bacterium]|nr:MoeZ/MoeB [Gemmatimonadota bacterium]
MTIPPLDRARDQMLLPGFGAEGQARLAASSVLCARIGGLGGPAALELAVAGIGRLRVAHGEPIKPAHMHRMIAMADTALGDPGIDSGIEALRRVNGDIVYEAIGSDTCSREHAKELVAGMDAVLSAPPSMEQRLWLNEAAVCARIPFIDAAMHGWLGQVLVVLPGESACLACLCESPPPLEKPFPVLGATSAVAGCIGAAEVVKILAGLPGGPGGRLLRFDLARWSFQRLDAPRRPDCPVCSGAS